MLKRLQSFAQKYNNLIIFLIIALAAFLRLYRIDEYMTFLGDEGRDVLVVKHILEGKLTLLGPTASVGGFFLGPIYYYFMAPFLWLFNYNPVGPAVMVALFGTATVWLVYKIGSEFFDKKTGFIAAFLYTISPLVISYSRSSWNPNLMPFFSLLTLYIVYRSLGDKKHKLLIVAGILFGILMQLHYISVFLLFIIFVYVITIRIYDYHKLNLDSIIRSLKDYTLFSLGFLIGWSPFLLFEVRHGFPNIRSIFQFIFNSGEVSSGSNFFAIIWDVLFRLFGRLVTRFPPPEQITVNLHSDIGIWYYSTILLAFISIGIFMFDYYKSFVKKQRIFYHRNLIFLWLFLGVFLFGFYKKEIHDYYLSFMFPLPFLLVGNVLSFLFNKKILIIKSLSVCFFFILVYINLQGVPFRNTPNRQLAQVELISRFVFDKAGGDPFNFALITGGNSDHAYRYFFELWGNSPVTIENLQVDPQRQSVRQKLLIICESNPNCSPLGNSLWEIAGFGRAQIVGEWDVSVVKVYELEHYKEN